MNIILNNKPYRFLVGYQNDKKDRLAFNDLSIKTFGLSFEEWYVSGYWREKYIPYTLFDGEKAIANASINIMDFNVFGQPKRFIQVGTVMTDEDYRKQNLSRFLMEKIVADWNDQCDFIYLFANNTVLDFYPKLGFTRFKEYEYFKTLDFPIQNPSYEKLNMDIQKNREMLHEYVKNSLAFSPLSMAENADLVLFYCITFLKDSVYHIKSLDVMAVATFKNAELCLWDVFGKSAVELDQVIQSLAHSGINSVLLGFTPKDGSSYQVREIAEHDVLFIQNNKGKIFAENKIMFPLLSHA